MSTFNFADHKTLAEAVTALKQSRRRAAAADQLYQLTEQEQTISRVREAFQHVYASLLPLISNSGLSYEFVASDRDEGAWCDLVFRPFSNDDCVLLRYGVTNYSPQNFGLNGSHLDAEELAIALNRAQTTPPQVMRPQDMERAIALALVVEILAQGHLISVNNGGEKNELNHSSDLDAIMAALFAAAEDYLYIYNPERGGVLSEGNYDYWVRLVYGNDGWDVICDYSVSAEMYMTTANKLSEQFQGGDESC